MELKRFGVSLEEDLLSALDEFVEERHFPNRSQALRYLIKNNIVRKKWEENEVVAGAIVLVYDHHKRDLMHQLTDLQHDYHELILSSQHFHLERSLCMEIIAVKGMAKKLIELSDKLIAVKGIHHGKLTMSRAD